MRLRLIVMSAIMPTSYLPPLCHLLTIPLLSGDSILRGSANDFEQREIEMRTHICSLTRMCIPFCIPVPDWPYFSESAEFRQFRGTHAGIKSFQGKINLFQNPTESGIPTGIQEGRGRT